VITGNDLFFAGGATVRRVSVKGGAVTPHGLVPDSRAPSQWATAESDAIDCEDGPYHTACRRECTGKA
jgi:hypothetical protein